MNAYISAQNQVAAELFKIDADSEANLLKGGRISLTQQNIEKNVAVLSNKMAGASNTILKLS
jgi:hypothetical protein